MRSAYPLIALLLTNSAVAEAKSPMPTVAQLSDAIAKQTKQPVSAADVRPLRCDGFAEEPTEFECRWTQKVKGRWRHYSTYFAIEGAGWTIIDWPPSKLK